MKRLKLDTEENEGTQRALRLEDSDKASSVKHHRGWTDLCLVGTLRHSTVQKTEHKGQTQPAILLI